MARADLPHAVGPAMIRAKVTSPSFGWSCVGMDNVLTLIANPAVAVLDDSIILHVCAALETLGAETMAPEWLSEGEAVDIPFTGTNFGPAESAAIGVLSGAAIDVIVQKTDRRQKKLLIADMDSTIVTGETLDELAEFAGLKAEITAITKRAMQGELDFAEALHTRVNMLKGLDESFLARTMEHVKLTPGAQTLVKTMRANGAIAALISGGFSYFTDRVRERVGFDSSLGNQLEIIDGKLTGRVIPPIVGKDVKREMLIDIAEQQGLDLAQTMAIGDGANDVPMLVTAGTGIAYHAHPVARTAARARLDHADLSGALFAQGYHRKDFID